jgi:hypothetical protein
MTENQWPQDPTYKDPPANPGSTGERSATAFPAAAAPQTTDPYSQSGGTSGTSRREAVKDEAGEVARTAKDSAQNVAETARTEAANVASEVKASTKDLLAQARTDLTHQAGAQQQKVADGLRSVSNELHAMAQASDHPGVASDLVRQAAERSSSVASWLDARDPGSLLDEVKSFARQRPGTFLLLAAGDGVLAGRLSRSLSAGAPEPTARSTAGGTPDFSGDQYRSDQYRRDQYSGDQFNEGQSREGQYREGQSREGQYAGEPYGAGQSAPGGYAPSGGAVPPPPVQVPGPATTTAGFDGGAPGRYAGEGSQVGENMYAGATSAASPLDSPQLAENPRSGNRMADDPLRDKDLADDPMGNDPLTRDRSADGQTGRP